MAARLLGVKVTAVRIGFGKPLFTFESKKRGTKFTFSPLIFGGEIKLLKLQDFEVSISEDASKSFNHQTLFRRLIIIFAGPAASILVPIIIVSWFLSQGIVDASPVIRDPFQSTFASVTGLKEGDRIVQVNGERTYAWWQFEEQVQQARNTFQPLSIDLVTAEGGAKKIRLSKQDLATLSGEVRNTVKNLGLERIRGDAEPVLGRVIANGAASRSGLNTGDHIYEVAGQRVMSWRQISKVVELYPEIPILIRFTRDGKDHHVFVTPTTRDYGHIKLGTLGVFPFYDLSAAVASYADRAMPGPVAIRGSFLYAFGVLQKPIEKLINLTGSKLSASFSASPVIAAESVTDAMQGGPLRSIALLCVLSFAIGWFNLLPIPPLDGGQALLALFARSK